MVMLKIAAAALERHELVTIESMEL